MVPTMNTAPASLARKRAWAFAKNAPKLQPVISDSASKSKVLDADDAIRLTVRPFEVVFVNPDDPLEPFWWPGVIIPPELLDESIPTPKEGELVVFYFEDGTYSITSISDVALFRIDQRPYIDFAKSRGVEFLMHPGVQRAIQFIETGKLHEDMKGIGIPSSPPRNSNSEGAAPVTSAPDVSKHARSIVMQRCSGDGPRAHDLDGAVVMVHDPSTDDIYPAQVLASEMRVSSGRRKFSEQYYKVRALLPYLAPSATRQRRARPRNLSSSSTPTPTPPPQSVASSSAPTPTPLSSSASSAAVGVASSSSLASEAPVAPSPVCLEEWVPASMVRLCVTTKKAKEGSASVRASKTCCPSSSEANASEATTEGGADGHAAEVSSAVAPTRKRGKFDNTNRERSEFRSLATR